MDVRVGLWRRLSAEELMPLNCGVGEDSWESLRLQGGPTNPFWRRSALGFLLEGMILKLKLQYFGHLMRSWLIGKESDSWRDWGQENKGMPEDQMAGWHHWLDGCESEWAPGVGDGQGGLGCCDSWGRKESDTTEQLNWTELNISLYLCVFFFFFFLSSTDRNLGYFHILAIATNGVMNRRCAYIFFNECFHFLQINTLK